ncbi:MAG: ABC transporter permease [Candidatus Njordarchaeia archaeon]
MYKIILKRGLLIQSIFVVSISIMLVTSVLLESEYISYAIVNKSLDEALIDIDINVKKLCWENYTVAEEKLANLTFVNWVNHILLGFHKQIIVKSRWKTIYPAENATYQIAIAGLNYSIWATNITIVNGKFPTHGLNALLDESLAKKLNVSIGDIISVYNPFIPSIFNVTIVGLFNPRGVLKNLLNEEDLIETPIPLKVRNNTLGSIILPINELINSSSIGGILAVTPHYLLKIDRRSYLNPWDPDYMTKKVESIEDILVRKIKEVDSKLQIDVKNNIITIIKTYSSWPTAMRYQLLYASLPGIMGGSVAAVVIGWIYIYKRKKEIALLKARGYSDRHLFKMTAVEFSLISVFSTIVGLFMSLIITLLASYLVYPNLSSVYPPFSMLLKSSENYILASFLLSLIITFLEVVPATYSASKINILDGLNPHLEVLESEKIDKNSYALLALGVYSILEIVSGLPVFYYSKNILLHSNLALTQVSGLLLFIFDLMAISAGAFAFAYGLSSVISYYSSKFEKFQTFLTKMFAGPLFEVGIRHFQRRPSRVSRILLIIILLTAFTLEADLNAQSNLNIVKSGSHLAVGGDYRVELVGFPETSGITPSVIDRLNNIVNQIESICNGTVATTIYYDWTISRTEGYSLPYILLIGIDEKYFKVTSFKDDYLEGTNVAVAEKMIFNGSYALASISSKQLGIKKGDFINVRSLRASLEITFQVAGFIKFLPGISTDMYFLQQQNFLVFLVNKEIFPHILRMPRTFLIHAPRGVNKTYFETSLYDIFLNAGVYADIYSYRDVERYFEKESVAGIMIAIFETESVIFFILTILGIYFIFQIENLERRKEYALLMSRGVDEKYIIRTGIGEALFIALISVIIGIFIALDFSYSLLIFINLATAGGFTPPPEYSLVISSTTILVPIVIFCLILVIAYFTCKKALKIDLPTEIRSPV